MIDGFVLFCLVAMGTVAVVSVSVLDDFLFFENYERAWNVIFFLEEGTSCLVLSCQFHKLV
jgi:hypothetical protein